MGARGYVVRGTHVKQGAIAAWSSDGSIGGINGAVRFKTLDAAAGARDALVYRGCSDVAIFRVHDDGREERLPSYEEALALLGADPLAALEVAERRLLEAGGWRENRAGWVCPIRRMVWTRESALTIERRRLAAKGGA